MESKSKLNVKLSIILFLSIYLFMMLQSRLIVYGTTYEEQAHTYEEVEQLVLMDTNEDTDVINEDTDILNKETDSEEPKIIHEVIKVDKKVEVEKKISPFKLKDLGIFKVTAYCPCSKCCGQWADNPKTKITSTGAGAYEGVTIAVDPKLIPYGTKLYTKEFGVRMATDCGGAIKGKRLDLYFSSHAKALEFGVKNVRLYAIED